MEYTSLEQGKMLMGLGLKVEGADLAWYKREGGYYEIGLKDYAIAKDTFSVRSENIVPAWSVEALLEEIPECIKVGDAYFKFLLLRKGGYWYATYRDEVFNQPIYNGTYISLVNILVNIVKWLLENKHIER